MRKISCFLVLFCLWCAIPYSVYAKTEQEYQQEIQTLQKKNAKLDAKIKRLQEQITKIIKEGEENAREVKETRAAMKQVKNQLTSMLDQESQADVQKIQQQLAQAMQQIQGLNKELMEVNQEKQRLARALENLEGRQPTGETETLRGDLNAVRTALGAQQEEVALLRSSSVEKDAEIRRLEGELLKAAEYIQNRDQEIEALRQLDQQKAASDVQTDDMLKDAEIRRLEGELLKAAEYIKEREQELKALKERDQQKVVSGQTVNAQISELEAALNNANTKIMLLLQEKSQLEALVAERQDLQTRNATKDTEIQRLEEELRKAAGQINSYNANIAALQQKNIDLQAQVDDSGKKNTELTSRLSQNSESLNTQSKLKASLNKKVAEVQTSLEVTEQQNKKLREDLHNAEQQSEKLRQDIAEVENKLLTQASVPEAAKKRVQELTSELQETRMQLDKQHRLEQEYPKLQQETDGLHEEVARLAKEQARADALQTKLREFEFAFEQARREVEIVASQNIELKKELQSKGELYGVNTQRDKEISARNAELEKKYQEAYSEVALKEQVLQKVATEKSILEKVIDEKGSPFDTLKARLRQAEQHNALLRQQLQELNASQVLEMQVQEEVSVRIASLENQLRQEKMLRQRTETQLQKARPQSPSGQAGGITPVLTRPSYSEEAYFLNNVFPPEISQKSAGNAVTLLGWSPNRTRLAYQETTATLERLWIFNMQTRQPFRVTQWQRTSGDSMSSFAWAHDNMHFLFATGLPGHYAIYVGNGNTLIASPIHIRDQHIHFAWSPAQLQFAYFSGSALVIQSVEGSSQPVQIGHQPGAVGTSLEWAPDGSRIAFSSKRGSSFDIFVMMYSGQKPLLQTLVSSSSDDIQPSWSPDGQNIAFYVRSEGYDTKIAVIPVDKSRSPYVVAHNVSVPQAGGPVWLTNTKLLYVGEEYLSASQNSLYRVEITTGWRASVPMTVVFSR